MYVAAVLAGYVVSRDEHRHATRAIRSHCCAVRRSRGTDSSANLAGGEDGDDAQRLAAIKVERVAIRLRIEHGRENEAFERRHVADGNWWLDD